MFKQLNQDAQLSHNNRATLLVTSLLEMRLISGVWRLAWRWRRVWWHV